MSDKLPNFMGIAGDQSRESQPTPAAPAQGEPYPSDWNALGSLLAKIAPWAEATFPREGTVQKLEHLTEEVQELIQSPSDTEEWADCFSLLFDAARKYGLTISQIVAAMRAKFEKNKLRQWDDGGENGVYHHIKPASHPPIARGLEEIASRTYLEKFTRKDDPDVIGAAIVSYGIDVLTDYARQSQERVASEEKVSDDLREMSDKYHKDYDDMEEHAYCLTEKLKASQERVAELEADNKRLSLDYEEYRNELPKQMAHQASKLRQQLHVQLNAAEERVAELERENGILRSTKPITFKGTDKAIARADAAEAHVAELERERDEYKKAALEQADSASDSEAALHAACDELDRLIAKYVCWNSACKDESHVQIKAMVAELRGRTNKDEAKANPA